MMSMHRVFALAFLQACAALTLHVKAGPDGRAIGDCPFAHACRLVASAKNLPLDIEPHAPNAKPAWLVEQHEGKMPCLVDASRVVTESRDIANYLDQSYPPALSLSSSLDLQAAEEAAKPVFMAFARYCKSIEGGTEQDTELKKALLLALCTLDAALSKAPAGQFLCGSQPSMADCFLLPALYHMQVAGKAFKDFDVPVQFDSLRQYMDGAFATPLFSSCAPEPSMVRWGWANARGDADAAAAAAAECGGVAA